MLVDQNVGRALSSELGGSDDEHIGPTTEAVCELGVASRRNRKRAEVVDTDSDARTFRERQMAIPGPFGRGMEMIGQRTVSLGVFRAWHFKQ